MSGGLVVRGVRPGDLEAVTVLERATFSDPWSRASFAELLGRGGVRFMAAERDGIVVGYCVGLVVADEVDLANLAVAPSARRGGVGRALVQDLLAAASEGGARVVFLEVRASNAEAQALYASLGFVATGRRRGYYSRPAEDALLMRLDLAAVPAPATE